MNYDLADLLKRSFDPYFEAPMAAWNQFSAQCTIDEIAKGTILKKANRAETSFHFIIQGVVGLFLIGERNSVCVDFAFDYQFCADYMSVITKQPTPLEMCTLEPCILASMPLSTFRELGSTGIGLQLMLVSAESSFVDKQQQQIDLLTKTAKQRLMELETKYPGISHRVAQKHIASYLGITPQSLSRILNTKV